MMDLQESNTLALHTHCITFRNPAQLAIHTCCSCCILCRSGRPSSVAKEDSAAQARASPRVDAAARERARHRAATARAALEECSDPDSDAGVQVRVEST